MFDSYFLWLCIFVLLLAGFFAIMWSTNKRKTYFIYFLAGMLLGFYFDLASFVNGYYSYPGFYSMTLLGLPLTMTIAEGFSVTIVMRLFEYTKTLEFFRSDQGH
jgi:hypothetical protein